MNVVGVTSDESYFKYAKVLINSTYVHNPSTDISYRVINFNPNHAFPNTVKIKSVVENISQKRTRLMKGVDIKHPRMKSLRTRLMSEQAIYTAHDKYTHIMQLLEEGYDRIMIVDADMIVRGNLDELFDVLDGCDLAMMRHDNLNNFIKTSILSEGVILCNNCGSIKTFFERVVSQIKQISATSAYDVDTDTEVIADIFNRSNISFTPLEKKYKDADLHDESIIWSGQGASKATDRFKSQMLLYEN